MVAAVEQIAEGRIGFETDGSEHDGMVEFAEGVNNASALFKDAMHSANCSLMLTAEYTFLGKELEYAESDEDDAESSAAAAIASFDDAFLALQAIENKAAYIGAELTFPHRKGWRYNGYPNDAFHIACSGHIRRIKNGLSRFGINRRDRELAQIRIQMFELAQSMYLEKQKKALEK
jgi:hypothetical protein